MIAHEGYAPISVAGMAALAVAYLAGITWSLPLWALAGFLLILFRETPPAIPNVPLGVLSPGDGTVVDVIEAHDPWLDRGARRVRVRLERLGIGVLRSPVEGKIMDYWTSSQPFNDGEILHTPGFSPNCYSTWVQTDEGDDVVFSVSSLRPISRFKLYSAPGERIGIGQRIGFVYFGNVLDVFMPSRTRAETAAGVAVRSGCSVLGRLLREQNASPKAIASS